MCTLSWLPAGAGYHVFYNRDERRSRARGEAPRAGMARGVQFLAPRDPESGGTWIVVNALGITVCLLNRYQDAVTAEPGPRSRGSLVMGLADLAAVEDLPGRVAADRLPDYAPFTTVAFDGVHACLAAWNGSELTMRRHDRPGLVETSTAVDGAAVHATRRRLFDSERLSVERLTALHRSHLPRKGSASVCMHRDDAGTVSFSHIAVSPEDVRFRYVDGPPCEATSDESFRLGRAPSLSVG